MKNDLHIVEVKVRLTERQAELLEALSRYHDTPRAVIARDFIQQALETVTPRSSQEITVA